jgi:urocanate hydratase
MYATYVTVHHDSVLFVPSYDRLYALGVSQFGQMTAGSYCYIGPQGIVHGTTLTLLNASRL